MNYRDIKPKREKCVTSLQYSDIKLSSGNTFVVLAKDGNSQETSLFSRKKKQEIRIYSLTHL